MKKLFAIVLALAMVLSMAACGSTGDSGSASTSDSTAAGDTATSDSSSGGDDKIVRGDGLDQTIEISGAEDDAFAHRGPPWSGFPLFYHT